jgi:pyruvate/2-oxoglutarate/acetoin dehydrogenase E1 component
MSSAPALFPSASLANALLKAQRQALLEDADVVLLGENVGRMGGLRGESQGLLAEFGPNRVIDTPIAEGATLGLAAGLAMAGKKVIVSLSGPDRLAGAWEVLRLELANLQNRTQGAFASTVVIRVPAGRGTGGGRYLEAAPEGNLANVEGLRVLSPSNGTEASAMLLAAVQAQGPTVIIESNTLWSAHSKSTAKGSALAIDGASIVATGEDISILAYGGTVALARKLAERGEKEGFSAEIVDLRSLRPLDLSTIGKSVRKTGRILFLHESEAMVYRVFGAVIETSFMYLEAPPASSQSQDLDELVERIWEILET